MSYLTTINGKQIFGNNEHYPEWIEFVKSQGVAVDGDGCYKGEITDVKGLFITIDKITRRLIKEQDDRVARKEKTWNDKPVRRLTDFSEHFYLDDSTPLLLFNRDVVENSYCFFPYQVFKVIEDCIQRCDTYKDTADVDWSFCSYELKPDCHIYVRAS